MLRSYLKLAWKVLLRRPFFTGISLFGISFTLMILLVVVAFVDHVNGPQTPEKRIDRMLFISSLRQRIVGGNGWNNSPISSHFIDTYVRTMRTPQQVAAVSMTEDATAYINGHRLKLDLRYADGNFWQMMDFDFLEGRPYTTTEVRQAAAVVVVNESTARAYFGTATGVVGRTVEANLRRFRVTGVVRDVPAVRLYTYADLWVPSTLSAGENGSRQLNGGFLAILLARDPSGVAAMSAEFQQVMQRVPIPNPEFIDRLYSFADPVLGSLTRQLFFSGTNQGDNLLLFYTLAGALTLLFMLLPTLNLVNLNITRILERSSEIGVRKAFGASGAVLIGQFLVENLVLSLLGGALGLALAEMMLYIINSSHIVAYSHFQLNWRIFGWGLGLAVVFGLLSGVYPAWRMSRLNPITALKGQAK